MKSYFLVLAICLGLGYLASCDFADNDDELKGGKIFLKIDGRNVEIEAGNVALIDYTQAGGQGYNLLIGGGETNIGGSSGEGFTISMSFPEDPPTTKTYPQTTEAGDNVLFGYVISTGQSRGATYTSLSGEITLTKYDVNNKKVSGTFRATLEKTIEFPTGSDNQPDRVEVTGGSFEDLSLQI